MDTLKILSSEDLAMLKATIAEAEKRTSGEIRVFIEDNAEDGPLDRAAFLFARLQMHRTRLRNGVLIYLDYDDRKFAIIGDKGIHEKVGDDFWDQIKNNMTVKFREGKFFEGLTNAVRETGIALEKYFPYSGGDRNELPDDVIIG